jgi:hypothetical protein
MGYVCSSDCLSKDLFIIPRDFGLSYDLKPKPVCNLAAIFLNRKCYLQIPSNHPQIKLQQAFYKFMVQRRRLHKLYDLLRCEQKTVALEKKGFAGDKNLILKDCYLSWS